VQRQETGAPRLPEVFDPARSQVFHYRGFDYDPATGVLTCNYALDDLEFAEVVGFHLAPHHEGDPAPDEPPAGLVARALRLVYLLAGVSYYKAGCPPVVDLGDDALTEAERALLEAFYVHGLGEFAYRNELDLGGLQIRAPEAGRPSPPPTGVDRRTGEGRSPLVPFGGGIDSIVSVEAVRPEQSHARLFVLNEFPAIEASIDTTRLDVVRATRRIDPALLELNTRGARNGHVPITGILSAIAVASAVLHGADEVVMSNEWSASSGNLTWNGREVNHQWSKSLEFETLFRAVVHESLGGAVDYFSLLRPLTSLRIAQLFAQHPAYLQTFRSCNRAFHIDEHARRTEWCGECDKCCFVDLILSPFIDATTLDEVFGGREPLQRESLRPQFDLLLSLGDGRKPFECVGDERECRAAAILAARRHDRAGHAMVQALARDALAHEPDLPAHVDSLLAPVGPHHVPPHHAAAIGLG
jgi:UDP-N-acetyl-alpha-D-muramoyl-L-alanyl-L-glutamate epimerase